ncbi:MAG: hypothetical protein ACRDP6_44400 [Actinoallomurus sp.]
MLLRLAYLTVANTFAVLRLLPMSDRDKDTEILAPPDRLRLLVRPDTILRWHRDVIARRDAARTDPG